MAKAKPQWSEISEFGTMAEKLVAKYSERFQGIDTARIVAYGHDKDDTDTGKAKKYDMTGQIEPESFTNSKQYFVKMSTAFWEEKTEEQKLALVFSAISRIDPENPGKVGPLDYRDQNVMVRTLGPDWDEKEGIPHLLNDNVDFKE